MKVTAIFDIGKTNKKFFLFDENLKEVHQEYVQIKEIKDEDGFPCDDLQKIEEWIFDCFFKTLKNKKYQLIGVNFSTYGASFVHLDKKGKVVTPFYNYLKPIPDRIIDDFYKKYGGKNKFSKETASPALGMLNSGLQLYWLKHSKPEVYKKIKYSLHFPQYLSSLFSGKLVSEFTSIGCHTGLWNFSKNDYHKWVYKEGVDEKLPTIFPTDSNFIFKNKTEKIKIGIGVHDSSSALIPYLKKSKEPFVLLSTGTWSIAMNPFNQAILSKDDLKNDCLNFLSIKGKPIKVARLFLGNEHSIQVGKLNTFFGKNEHYHRSISFDVGLMKKVEQLNRSSFKFESIHLKRQKTKKSNSTFFINYEEAYHQLMYELIELQIQSLGKVIGETSIKTIYIDGGFSENEIFIKLLKRHFKNKKIKIAKYPNGSALGAAYVLYNFRTWK